VDLEFVEGTSSKFWRARVDGSTVTVNYGRIGTTGQTQPKDFGDVGAAQKEYDKLVREKRKKGYVDAGGGGSSPPDDDDRDDDGGDDDEAPPPAPRPTAPPPVAARPPGTRLVLEAGTRKVETYVSIDGKTVRMEAIETYASPDAAKKAHDRLKKQLAGEGYQEK
jgi:predicted DNA-binding WGR domain protein